jgi:serine/threonine-protein kinase
MDKSTVRTERSSQSKPSNALPPVDSSLNLRIQPQPKPSRSFIRRISTRATIAIALTAFAALTFALFAVVGLQTALLLREVQVPDLAGRSVDDARLLLDEADLLLSVESLSRIHKSIPANHIAAQDPAPGLTTRNRRSVKVWLSSGSSASFVPTLLGQSENGARARLQEDALVLRELSEVRSNRYPSDAVIGQEPPPQGSSATVSVLLNRGERGVTYVMPDLIGVYGSPAAAFLRSGGFRVTVVGDHPYPGVAPDIVLRQSPQAGFQIAQGEAISLEVSQ